MPHCTLRPSIVDMCAGTRRIERSMVDRRRTVREFLAKGSLAVEDDDFPDGDRGFAEDSPTFLGVPTRDREYAQRAN